MSRLQFGLFEFDPATGELLREGIPVRLQPQPARVLGVLVGRAGEVVSREDLRQAVWPDGTFVDFERGLNFCIAQIRGALGDSAESPRFVETLPRRGYRFIAPVRARRPGSDLDFLTDVGPGSVRPGSDLDFLTDVRKSRSDPGRRPRLGAVAVVGGALALAVLVALAWTSDRRVRVAVVPFDNETGDARYSGLGQGIADATVARLATPDRVGRLAVIGNSAALRQPRSFRDLKAIGEAVDAEYVVLAQVKRDESRVRLIAHLIRVRDEAHVWAETFDRSAFTLDAQAEIAERIAGAVTSKLAGQ